MEPTKDGAVAQGSAAGVIQTAGPIRTAGRAVLTGKVVSDKMNKTIVVAIVNRRLHGLYKKYVQVTKKVKAHDEQNDAHEGDIVRVVESRPISKDKRWRLLEIVERAR